MLQYLHRKRMKIDRPPGGQKVSVQPLLCVVHG